jgi:serine/threonine protein kinase
MPIPQKLGHFNLLEEIGRGGMGSVFRAFDPTLNREVAIKVLREDWSRDPKFVGDFLQEARAAASISHPHIVQIHFVGEEAGQYYIVMELLHGRSLREIIEEDGPLNEERAVDVALEIAEGLRAAYRNQMIHGDIKPANIFITEEVGAKILDFGLAKLANVEVTEGGEIWGSPYYISPERVGQKAEDYRSDVYSLGATLFHALAGRPPFEATTADELAAKRLNEKPPLLREVIPNLTNKTEQVVNKMLNKSIFLRYRDYDALLEDLRDAKTEATAKRLGVDLHPEQFRPPEPAAAPPPKKSPLPLILGVIGVLIIAGVLAFIFRPKEKPAPPAPTPTPTPIIQKTEPPPTPRPVPTTKEPEPKPAPPPVNPPKLPEKTQPPPPPAPPMWNVEFSINAPTAKQVFLAGDFNNWSRTAVPMQKRPNGDWVIGLQFNAGTYKYKFFVDGKWTPDPDNPERTKDTYNDSILHVGN